MCPLRALSKADEPPKRHLDCAWFYQNEAEIGDAIQDFVKESNGKVKRDDLFICTKVWNHLHEPEEGMFKLTNHKAFSASREHRVS